MITSVEQLDLSKSYTYQDYLSWKIKGNVELIQGKVYKMPHGRTTLHQKVTGNLFLRIGHYLEGRNCEVFVAPFDVRLPLPLEQSSDNKIHTVVQPDICVICDLTKLDRRGCLGAPDWVIEVLSGSTSSKDTNEKFYSYQHAGVKEYWLVHPQEGMIWPYVANAEGKFKLVRERPFVRGEKVPVSIFPDFEVDLNKVFPEGGFYFS